MKLHGCLCPYVIEILNNTEWMNEWDNVRDLKQKVTEILSQYVIK